MPLETEVHDPSFLLKSSFSRQSGICPKASHRNAAPAVLYEKALLYEPGTHVVSSGALATTSGAKTGRCPQAKHVVREAGFQGQVWWGPASPNHAMDERAFLANREAAVDFLNSVDRVFVVDGYACWDPACRVKVRIITSLAHHALFATNMLIRPTQQQLADYGEPDFVIYNAGACPANKHNESPGGTTSIDISLGRREMVILGTRYAGEMKKGVFMLLHYYLPQRNVLFLHSGCNIGAAGDVTLFFGLSGTGKTTLATDAERPLIGDDEHCWGASGVFNIEGGCYAKAINLRPDSQPEIWGAIRFGTLLENVCYDPETREVDFDDASITENTRACYPIHYIRNAAIPCMAGHPCNIILLCCDAFGVLPPVSRLTPVQAMYHFISGYTAKVAGTEHGVSCPQATFSACYAGAFIMWHPLKYAGLLADKMQRAGCQAWLVNTGWCGGSAGGAGRRISLGHTRSIIAAIHSGELAAVQCVETPVFNLQVPVHCSGVPSDLLLPELQWKDSRQFDAVLSHLGVMFAANFQQFADGGGVVGPDVVARILTGGTQLRQQQQEPDCLPGEAAAEAAQQLPQQQQQGACLSSGSQLECHLPAEEQQAPLAAAAALLLANGKGSQQQQQQQQHCGNSDSNRAIR